MIIQAASSGDIPGLDRLRSSYAHLAPTLGVIVSAFVENLEDNHLSDTMARMPLVRSRLEAIKNDESIARSSANDLFDRAAQAVQKSGEHAWIRRIAADSLRRAEGLALETLQMQGVYDEAKDDTASMMWILNSLKDFTFHSQ